MGLDMYLEEKVFIGVDSSYNKVKANISIEKNGKQVKLPYVGNLSTLVYEKAYWRKANHIHKWFVDNVQDGVDDCKEYYVSVEQLEELKEKCREVIELAKTAPFTEEKYKDFLSGEDKSYKIYTNGEEFEAILPAQEGFFFGSTQYDEWYVKDCEYTLEMLQDLNSSYDYYYTSSW